MKKQCFRAIVSGIIFAVCLTCSVYAAQSETGKTSDAAAFTAETTVSSETAAGETASGDTVFTAKERAYIQQTGDIVLCFEAKTPPLAYVTEDTGQLQGILIDICEMISENTGLQFVYMQSDEENIIEIGNVYTFAMQMNPSDGQGEIPQDEETEAFFNCPFYLYHLQNNHFDAASDAVYHVAIPKNRGAVADYFKQRYPNYDVIEKDTPEECMALLESGEVELVFLNYYVANDYLVRHDISNVSVIPTSEMTFGIALSIHGEDAQTLISIINKGIERMGPDETDRLVLEYAMNIVPESTVRYFMRNNMATTVGGIIVVLVLISAALIWFIRYKAMCQQRELLEESNRRLKQASVAKTAFLSRMSHDIRTPMNGIIGITSLMKNREMSQEVREDVEKVDASAHFLLGLINDILDMTKAESGEIELNPGPYSGSAIGQYISAIIEPLCVQKGLELTVDMEDIETTVFMVDGTRLNQILFNLLSNAVKFTAEGGKVDFEAHCIECSEEGMQVQFIVRDNGIGMSEAFQAHMFETFSRENNELTSQIEGTGLGLSIVEYMLKLLKGTLEVESKTGEGTTFVINMPLSFASESDIRRFGAVPEEVKTIRIEKLKGMRVLVCEDHPLNREIVKRLLKQVGVVADMAENGRVGVVKFSNHPPDSYAAILMDIRMPIMDGLTAAAAIRSLNRCDAESIPIIALTANAFSEDVVAAYEAGMNTHLAKPVEAETLYRVLAFYALDREEENHAD